MLEYLSKMTQALSDGLVFTFSHWGNDKNGNDVAWLDVPPCQNNQGCFDGIATWSNFKLEPMSLIDF